MKRPLDTNPTTDAEGYDLPDIGPHYDPVRLVVDVTIDRDTFGPEHDAEDAAFKVLDDAVDLLDSEFNCAHSVKRVEPVSALDTPLMQDVFASALYYALDDLNSLTDSGPVNAEDSARIALKVQGYIELIEESVPEALIDGNLNGALRDADGALAYYREESAGWE